MTALSMQPPNGADVIVEIKPVLISLKAQKVVVTCFNHLQNNTKQKWEIGTSPITAFIGLRQKCLPRGPNLSVLNHRLWCLSFVKHITSRVSMSLASVAQ